MLEVTSAEYIYMKTLMNWCKGSLQKNYFPISEPNQNDPKYNINI